MGEVSEAGLGLFLGAVPPVLAAGRARAGGAASGGGRPGAAQPSAENAGRQTAAAVIGLWRRIGLAPGSLTEQVVVTPACGLAGASPTRARAVLAQCQAAARLIPELIEEGVA